MFFRVQDFCGRWTYEMEATRKLLQAMTDASLAQRVVPEGRTLGFLAWHNVLSIGEMMSKTGLLPVCPPEDAPCPGSAAEIASAFQQAAGSLLAEVREKWQDAQLQEEVSMYGQTWTLGQTLLVLILHLAHHRGQMTVLMRQAGLPVAGVYGPSREEWTRYGMPVQP